MCDEECRLSLNRPQQPEHERSCSQLSGVPAELRAWVHKVQNGVHILGNISEIVI
jgi:hypothetical protein